MYYYLFLLNILKKKKNTANKFINICIPGALNSSWDEVIILNTKLNIKFVKETL
jgi:hypothetical protein